MKDIFSVKMRHLLTLFSVMIFISCLSSEQAWEDENIDPVVVIPESRKLQDKVSSLLDNGDFLNALDYSLSETAQENPELFLPLREQAVRGLKKEFLDYTDNGDFSRALLLFNNISLYSGENTIEEWNRTSLVFENFRKMYEDGFQGAALAYFQENLTLEVLSSSQFEFLKEAVLAQQNYSLARSLKKYSRSEGLNLSPELKELSIDSRDIKDLLDGTVTIWVDKGVKIEQGMGSADIVIGSGFFIDPRGYLLTNYHVIESEVDPTYQGFSKLYVRLSEDSSEKIPARVIGWDKKFDLALVKVEMDAPFTFSFASSNEYSLGQPIFAIGSPAGLMGTVTSGTISSINREVLAMGNTLQVDVPINPGNSGGPLLNQDGEVIGVVFAGIQQFDGINFVIPGYYVKTLLPALYKGGPVEHLWAGMGLTTDLNKVLVNYIAPGTSAQLVGIKKGDYILSVNGESADSIKKLQDLVLPRQKGGLLEIEWMHEGQKNRGFISLRKRPRDPFLYLLDRDLRENLFAPMFGFDVEGIGRISSRGRFRVTQIYPGSAAYESGFSKGDLISVKRWTPDPKRRIIQLDFIYEGKNSGFLQSGYSIACYTDSSHMF